MPKRRYFAGCFPGGDFFSAAAFCSASSRCLPRQRILNCNRRHIQLKNGFEFNLNEFVTIIHYRNIVIGGVKLLNCFLVSASTLFRICISPSYKRGGVQAIPRVIWPFGIVEWQ